MRRCGSRPKPGDVPYAIICDPEQSLFREFELLVAASKETMTAPEEQEAYAAVRKRFDEYGLVHGAYEGEELQLPGYFILTRRGRCSKLIGHGRCWICPRRRKMAAKL